MVGVIIQARMGSSRLPGKTLQDLCGNPLLYYSVQRASQSKYADQVIVATSNKIEDDAVEKWCVDNHVLCFRGSEKDVLDRYYQCAKKNDLDVIVRATADNPFIDPTIIDLLITTLKTYDANYVTMRHHTNTWPYGLDVEAMDMAALKKAWELSHLESHREHVTMYIKDNKNDFYIKEVKIHENLSMIRLTVDYQDDFNRANQIMKQLLLKYDLNFSWHHVIDIYNNLQKGDSHG